MQSRRNIRIKAMQAVYAYTMHAFPSRQAAHKTIRQLVQAPYNMLLFNLLILTRIAQYVLIEEKIRKQKHLPTEEDIHFSVKLHNNLWLQQISHHNIFRKALQERYLDAIDIEALIRVLFKGLYDRTEYKRYVITEEHDPQADKDIVLFLYSDIMLQSPLYESTMEEHFPTWHDDAAFTRLMTQECLNGLEQMNLDSFFQQLTDTSAQELFAIDLFDKTLDYDEQLQLLIMPHLENWDVDRVATLDMILIKMALAEILYFPTIPVKVSINEYIEISKHYSGMKSKDFINGVLDKIMQLLKAEGKIVKSGRGLVE